MEPELGLSHVVGAVDAVLPAGEIEPALARLTGVAPAIRSPSAFTCPERLEERAE